MSTDLFIHHTVGLGGEQGSARWIIGWYSNNICSPESDSPIPLLELKGATVRVHTLCLILTSFSSFRPHMYWYIFIQYYVFSISICWIELCKCVLANSIKWYCQARNSTITLEVLFIHFIKNAKLWGICRLTAFIYCWGKIFTSRNLEFHLFWCIVGGVLKKAFGENAMSSIIALILVSPECAWKWTDCL